MRALERGGSRSVDREREMCRAPAAAQHLRWHRHPLGHTPTRKYRSLVSPDPQNPKDPNPIVDPSHAESLSRLPTNLTPSKAPRFCLTDLRQWKLLWMCRISGFGGLNARRVGLAVEKGYEAKYAGTSFVAPPEKQIGKLAADKWPIIQKGMFKDCQTTRERVAWISKLPGINKSHAEISLRCRRELFQARPGQGARRSCAVVRQG